MQRNHLFEVPQLSLWIKWSKRTHISWRSREETLKPKSTCLCSNLEFFEHEVIHMGKTCSMVETWSGESTGKHSGLGISIRKR